MSDTVSLNRRVGALDISPVFAPYSRVIINISDDTQISVGDDTGRTYEIDNPQGTRKMANDLLEKFSTGFQYQPYSAKGAVLDPSAEIGDGVSIRDIYGGIYNRKLSFTRLMEADISAPGEEEINHEYKFETPAERKYRREMGDVRATILVQDGRITAEVNERIAQGQEFSSQLSQQSTEIAAKVSQTGGSNSSFGWSLKASKFSLYAGNKEVFKATSSGITVDGTITAREGYIGNGESGFTIKSSCIYNNISSYGGSQSKGIYIGTNGIQLGQKFKVSSSGDVYANNMTLTGTLTVGSGQISADTLRGGAATAASKAPTWNGTTKTVDNGKTNWDSAYSRVTNAYVGNYQLNFGTGIVIRGNAFTDSTGGKCSGSTTRSNVVTCSYVG